MTYQVYAIKDVKVGYMQPFYLQNDEIAKREFAKAAQAKEPNAVNEFIDDKELWHIGTYCEDNGELNGDLYFIVKANQCLSKKGGK